MVDPEVKKIFSRRVAALREARELTQADLGRKVGVSGTCVWNWEGGNTYPRPATMKRLAQVLRTSPDSLNGRENETDSTIKQDGARPLADIIMDARQTVALAAGIPVSSVRIVLDCGD